MFPQDSLDSPHRAKLQQLLDVFIHKNFLHDILTLIWRCLNPSKRNLFLCPGVLIYCKKASRAALLNGSVDVGKGVASLNLVEADIVVMD